MREGGDVPIEVDPSNAGQWEAWDGDQGDFWTQHADDFDRAVAAHHEAFLDAAEPATGERVLDVGCGSGLTTRDAARRVGPSGEVLGVDLSSSMIELARRRAAAEGLAGVRFEQVDAQAHPFPAGGFDLVISRHGSMFFGDPPAAFGNLARATRPGGRLALLVWRGMADNEFFTAPRAAVALGRELPGPPPDGPGPFSLADPDRVRALLTGAGFADVELRAQDLPMTVGRDAAEAAGFLTGQFGWALRDLSDTDRDRALAGLREVVATHTGPDGVQLGSAAWLITARRP